MGVPEKVINNILGKGYKKGDKDLDGVKDKKDCQPNNPMRQDIARRGLGKIQERLGGKPY